MTGTWSTHEIGRIAAADELQIAARDADGALRRFTPIWAVCVDGDVYVRTWHRRGTGWFGRVVESRRARVRVPGLEAEVAVEDVGEGSAALRAAVDAAYRAKYERYGRGSVDPMTTDDAVAATLRLSRVDG